MKMEVYRRQTVIQDDFFARISDAAAAAVRIKKRENQRRQQEIFAHETQSALKLVAGYSNIHCELYQICHLNINPLTPNDDYSGRTAPLTSKRCILYIYSTNIGTEYFKHGIYSPFFPLQNAVCLINLTYLVSVLCIFYVQGVLKLKK